MRSDTARAFPRKMPADLLRSQVPGRRLGDEKQTVGMARELNHRGLFVVGFTYPVVPRGAARIRVQVSAAHTPEDLETAVNLSEEVGVKVGYLT